MNYIIINFINIYINLITYCVTILQRKQLKTM